MPSRSNLQPSTPYILLSRNLPLAHPGFLFQSLLLTVIGASRAIFCNSNPTLAMSYSQIHRNRTIVRVGKKPADRFPKEDLRIPFELFHDFFVSQVDTERYKNAKDIEAIGTLYANTF